MTDIEKIREWLKGFSGIPINFQIDYTDEVPQNAGLFPTGLVEVSRKSDIIGNVTITNQRSYSLYTVFDKPRNIDEISAENAEWIIALQDWAQEQSARNLAPKFGDKDLNQEVIKAQNGMFYGVKEDGTAGLYMVTLTVTYKKYYGE